MNRNSGWRLALIPALLASWLSGCDSNENRGVCPVAKVDNYSNMARFETNSAVRFTLEQKITTYETGDCEVPSSDDDGVRILVTNSSLCHLDLGYSLSVFQGTIGWTINGSIGVDGQRTTDTGKIVKRDDPRVDAAQIILTGKVTATVCP